MRASKYVDLSALLREVEEAAFAHDLPFVAIHSRRGYPVGQSYALTTLDQKAEFLHFLPGSRLVD